MTRRAVDERHRLAIAHPDWEGFLVAELTAPSDIERLDVVVDATLQDVIVAHHRAGPIFAGQVVPVDLEVDFALVRTRAAGAAISGTMHFRDATNTTRELCEPMRLTLACCRFRGCEIAGIDDGPIEPEDHEALCAALIGGSMTPDAAARRIRRAEQPNRRWWQIWR
jgi:hypothetical protein